MSLSIELEEHDGRKHFYLGEAIRGRVVFKLPKQRKIAFASITFRGKIDTEYVESRRGKAGSTHGPRVRAHEVLRLFEYTENLFRGPFDVPPQTFSWPFTFTIPTHVEHARVGNRSPGFIPDGISPLPPTLSWEDFTFTHDARARIKYKLVAHIDSGGLFKNEDIELSIPISRFSTVPPPYPQLVKHEFIPSPCWSSRELRDQPHSLKQKFRHLTSNDPELKTPCIAFKAWVHFPLQLAPDQKTAIAFSIQHHRVTPNDPEAPELVLDALRLSLYSRTAMTAANTAFGSSFSLTGDRYCQGSQHEAGTTISFKPTRLDLEGKEVYLSDSICLADWTASPHMSFMGDFETYTIMRGHRIRVEADVRHPATGHVFQLRTEIRFEVLDEYMPELASGMAIPRADGGTVTRYEDIDNELPAYHEDVRPPEVDSSTGKVEVLTKS
ncbi:hypothetical protein PMZ80_006555 [Knufia obscura]|uniref:Arrestin-like N-terminal domain-containing protein n=2 Tax=Knufia TaxID=430999 RepID=A0AAN8I3Z5_9EURO|nr:hypothetical protein PMZ80_006555 [Knufia obscura]KAK5950914.1 hypothetical protein OHC33_007986 [Knufia fluminis]